MTDIWSMLPAIASAAKDVLLTITALVAAYVGLKGLSTWRRQLKGNTEYALAKNVLTCLYELRGAIGVARNPFASYSAEPDLPAEKLESMDARQKEWYAYAQMYEKRWAPVVAAKSKLDVFLFEVEAVWGRGKLAEFTPLNEAVAELNWAIQDHLEDRDPRRGRQALDSEERKKQRAVLFRRGMKTKDEYNENFEQAISKIEAVLKPHVLEHHR
ncbi:hypothetical protein Dtpsy_3333 [[Acidovorax] ebreus TPSY]|uniref:Uncharacterized protein n=2 Tax=Diaphorobacter TaxID=238749 RepID=A0A9J9QCN2_ACIET|nr:hypothetical protein Dtpsy_3333 [[Acidovorax] ebreus TPSY]